MDNSVATSAALAIGVDLGGTHVLAVLMDRQGAILARHGQSLSAADRGSTPLIVGALVDCISSVHRQAPPTAPVLGVGVAVPGNVDPATSSTRYLPNFGWLEPVALGGVVVRRASLVRSPPPLPRRRAERTRRLPRASRAR